MATLRIVTCCIVLALMAAATPPALATASEYNLKRQVELLMKWWPGEADSPWPDGRTLTITIHSRAFTSPPECEYPLFRIHEKGKEVPIAYAYAVDDATHFGLNLGWFYIRCDAEGEDLDADAIYK